MIHRPGLGGDPKENRRSLQATLDTAGGGTLELPPGTHVLDSGLTVGDGWHLRGAETVAAGGGRPGTWLESIGTDGHPVLHVLGSGVKVSDLGLRPPPADPGEHGGDRGTAITVGEYLYRDTPQWIGDVELRRIRVERVRSGGATTDDAPPAVDRAANSIALMGAVRDVTLDDITVHGGYTGVAVHWGAVGADVASIAGPTYHPHRLTIGDLRVSDAVEGFYLSSVHDVQVSNACLRDVEMGFRLLPGDNTDRFAPHGDAPIGSRIDVSDICVRWTGDLYGIRVAGWGRSEVDGVVTVLRYTDTAIRDCVVSRATAAEAPHGTWSPVLMDRADGVTLHNVQLQSLLPTPCCAVGRTGD